MKSRRVFMKCAAAAAMALVVVAPAIADELLGVITKVDPEAKKLTVVEKDTDKEIEVTVTDDTEYVTPKGASKVDLKKMEGNLKKFQEKGAKGITVKIQHEKAVASKITVERKKKAQ